MDYTEMFSKLWDLVMGLIKTINVVWEWLSTNHVIGLKIDVINLNWSFTINPLALTGGVMVTLIVATFIKTFIPVA